MNNKINQLQLKELLIYNEHSGEFYWVNPGIYHMELVGKSAGSIVKTNNEKCYIAISINGIKYKRSRLAFLYMNGSFPKNCMDHINGNSLDDRWINLREATILENSWNHKFRKRKINLPMGVRITANGKYQSRINYCGTQIHLGSFNTIEEAEYVYQQKRKELYHEFA